MIRRHLPETWSNYYVIRLDVRPWATPRTTACCKIMMSGPWNAPSPVRFKACNNQSVRKPARHNWRRWAKENPLVNLLFRDHWDAVHAASVLERGVRARSHDDEAVRRNLPDLCPCVFGAPPWHSPLFRCAPSGLDGSVLRVCRLLMGEYGLAVHHDRPRQPDLHVRFHVRVLLHHHDRHRFGKKAVLVLYGGGWLGRLRLAVHAAGMAEGD